MKRLFFTEKDKYVFMLCSSAESICEERIFLQDTDPVKSSREALTTEISGRLSFCSHMCGSKHLITINTESS